MSDQNMNNANWGMPEEKAQEISLEFMDEQVKILYNLEKERDKVQAEADLLSKSVEEQKAKLLNLLEVSKKEKYLVDGIGAISIKEELSFKTPKTNEEKQAFFNWVKEKHGPQFLMTKVNFNSISLNSFLKKERDLELESGNTIFNVPGIEPFKTFKKLKLTKK